MAFSLKLSDARMCHQITDAKQAGGKTDADPFVMYFSYAKKALCYVYRARVKIGLSEESGLSALSSSLCDLPTAILKRAMMEKGKPRLSKNSCFEAPTKQYNGTEMPLHNCFLTLCVFSVSCKKFSQVGRLKKTKIFFLFLNLAQVKYSPAVRYDGLHTFGNPSHFASHQQDHKVCQCFGAVAF